MGEIEWTGNLKDDCRASWNGLYLHAEEMDKNYWWWAVSSEGGEEIDSSNNYERIFKNGSEARKAAEQVAQNYMTS